jgi:hypothetical protein
MDYRNASGQLFCLTKLLGCCFILYVKFNLREVVMYIPGYVDYKRREFCKDVRCPIQLELDGKTEGSEEYERIRKICKTDCRYTTYQFHHWLIEKGYLIVRPEK